MKNLIVIEFNHGIYKAFWNREYRVKINGHWYTKERSTWAFPAATKEQAEQRAKDFIEGTGEFSIPRPDITGVVWR